MGNPVVHFEIMTEGAAALRDFYANAFNWESHAASAPAGVDYATIHNESGVDGGIGEVPEGYDGHVTFYVGVPSVEAALAKIEQLGGTRMIGPDQVPGGPVIGLFRDPHQHLIGLVQTPGIG
ncbi:MAG TPA: VOC family protein [Candidatus Baltobacteraceae bacterium]|nr:VOC family protein [Candidatus Baltobacteraceae bacterium]